MSLCVYQHPKRNKVAKSNSVSIQPELQRLKAESHLLHSSNGFLLMEMMMETEDLQGSQLCVAQLWVCYQMLHRKKMTGGFRPAFLPFYPTKCLGA